MLRDKVIKVAWAGGMLLLSLVVVPSVYSGAAFAAWLLGGGSGTLYHVLWTAPAAAVSFVAVFLMTRAARRATGASWVAWLVGVAAGAVAAVGAVIFVGGALIRSP